MSTDKHPGVGTLVAQLRRTAGFSSQQKLADAMSTDVRPYTRSAVAGVESGSSLPGPDFIEALDRVIEGAAEQLREPLEDARNSRTLARPKPGGGTVRPQFVELLVAEVEHLFEEANYAAVVRYGQTFSRFLFLEHEIEARIRIGILSEEAAARTGDVESQIETLVDQLGWSLVVLQSYEEAERHVRHGLDLAQGQGLLYWQAKALRHLGGMLIELTDLDEAERLSEQARSVAEKMPDSKQKTEMLAGVEYGAAQIAYAKGEYEIAADALGKSEGLRKQVEDASRTVKTHAMFGKVFERKGNFPRAHDFYRRGLDEARKVGRKDEQIRNLLGLSRVVPHLGPNQTTASSAYVEEARELARRTPVPYEELADIETL